MAFYDSKIDIATLFKTQELKFSDMMIEVLVIVEIIQTRLGAKFITFDKNHDIEEVDFFIVQD